jgi:hypothetical protein
MLYQVLSFPSSRRHFVKILHAGFIGLVINASLLELFSSNSIEGPFCPVTVSQITSQTPSIGELKECKVFRGKRYFKGGN